MMTQGNPYKLNELRESLAYVYATETKKRPGPAMKGLATIMECKHCGKGGRKQKQCWKNIHNRTTLNTSKPKAEKEKKCWKCGKNGHLKRDCKAAGTARPGMAAAACAVPRSAPKNANYVDSACSVHMVSSLDLLQEVKRVEEGTVKSVGGKLIKLTHKGTRIIDTKEGPLKLTEAYYCQGLQYNLISVPKLADKAIEVSFSSREAYLKKGDVKIHLVRMDGLWAVPEVGQLKAASLRMSRGGASADDITWHE